MQLLVDVESARNCQWVFLKCLGRLGRATRHEHCSGYHGFYSFYKAKQLGLWKHRQHTLCQGLKQAHQCRSELCMQAWTRSFCSASAWCRCKLACSTDENRLEMYKHKQQGSQPLQLVCRHWRRARQPS